MKRKNVLGELVRSFSLVIDKNSASNDKKNPLIFCLSFVSSSVFKYIIEERRIL